MFSRWNCATHLHRIQPRTCRLNICIAVFLYFNLFTDTIPYGYLIDYSALLLIYSSNIPHYTVNSFCYDWTPWFCLCFLHGGNHKALVSGLSDTGVVTEQVNGSLSSLALQLRTDRGRLYGLLSKAVGGGNTEVTHRLSKVGQITLQGSKVKNVSWVRFQLSFIGSGLLWADFWDFVPF